MKDDIKGSALICVCVLIVVFNVSAWVNHLIICFSDDRWGFLIAGAICFPVAIFHGAGRWFGLW